MSAVLVIPIMAMLLAPALWLILGRPRYLAPATDNDGLAATLSVVIPARDEETNIAQLLDSLKKQSPQPLEIIVVNDGSTDNTAGIAKTHGARVIDAEPLPDGWMGKPWACQQGADAAQGQWLLFLDADVTLEDSAMSSLCQLCAEADRVHSVCPYHAIKQPYEELSAFFNVLMLAGVNAFGMSKRHNANSALFGQCLLISQHHYQAIGGHHSVSNRALENFHLAQELKRHGIPSSCYLGKGFIHMRMFPDGVKQLWDSWKKGFSGGAANTAPRALFLSSLWISGMMLTLVCIALSFSSYTSGLFCKFTAAAYLIHACQCVITFQRAGSFSLWNGILFPLSLLFYQVLFFSSVIDKKRGKTSQWKGRTVH